jgi:hypothetical protein
MFLRFWETLLLSNKKFSPPSRARGRISYGFEDGTVREGVREAIKGKFIEGYSDPSPAKNLAGFGISKNFVFLRVPLWLGCKNHCGRKVLVR